MIYINPAILETKKLPVSVFEGGLEDQVAPSRLVGVLRNQAEEFIRHRHLFTRRPSTPK